MYHAREVLSSNAIGQHCVQSEWRSMIDTVILAWYTSPCLN